MVCTSSPIRWVAERLRQSEARVTGKQVTLTQDVRPEWQSVADGILNVVRRLQSESKTDGCAVLTIRVAVGADGVPMCWSSPTVTRLEPKKSCRIDELLELLCE